MHPVISPSQMPLAAPAVLIPFEHVQQAVARCLQAYPAIDAVLPKESHLLVELMGRMIYAHVEVVDSASLSLATLDELGRWSSLPSLRAAA